MKLYESELLYAESFLHDLVLHTTGPDYRIRESISAFAGRLSADFFRTHRSYLVNLKAVVRIGRGGAKAQALAVLHHHAALRGNGMLKPARCVPPSGVWMLLTNAKMFSE